MEKIHDFRNPTFILLYNNDEFFETFEADNEIDNSNVGKKQKTCLNKFQDVMVNI